MESLGLAEQKSNWCGANVCKKIERCLQEQENNVGNVDHLFPTRNCGNI